MEAKIARIEGLNELKETIRQYAEENRQEVVMAKERKKKQGQVVWCFVVGRGAPQGEEEGGPGGKTKRLLSLSPHLSPDKSFLPFGTAA